MIRAYKSLAFMRCCDDAVRDNGSESKADRMYVVCGEPDRIPVCMKNDWTTIYGDGVAHVKPAAQPRKIRPFIPKKKPPAGGFFFSDCQKTAMPFFDKRLAAYCAHSLSANGGQFAHFVV